MEKLSSEDWSVILESLKYTKLKFENYPVGKDGYPDYEFKQRRIQQVIDVMKKVSDIAKSKKL